MSERNGQWSLLRVAIEGALTARNLYIIEGEGEREGGGGVRRAGNAIEGHKHHSIVGMVFFFN